MGTLKDVSGRELAITAAKAAIERSGVPADQIDEICMGQLFGGMQGSLPARQVSMRVGLVSMRVGLPHSSSAVTVNQNCTSGMRALEIACHNIMLGQTEIGLVVGTESMTNAPYLLPKARMGYRMGQGNIEDSMLHDGLFDELVPGHMGMTAENVAAKYGITRQECDELALISHSRCTTATKEGVFKREIVPVELKSKKGSTFFEADENFIPDASMEKMAKLPAALKDGEVAGRFQERWRGDCCQCLEYQRWRQCRGSDVPGQSEGDGHQAVAEAGQHLQCGY